MGHGEKVLLSFISQTVFIILSRAQLKTDFCWAVYVILC